MTQPFTPTPPAVAETVSSATPSEAAVSGTVSETSEPAAGLEGTTVTTVASLTTTTQLPTDVAAESSASIATPSPTDATVISSSSGESSTPTPTVDEAAVGQSVVATPTVLSAADASITTTVVDVAATPTPSSDAAAAAANLDTSASPTVAATYAAAAGADTTQSGNATTLTEKVAATVKSVVDKVLILLQDRRVLLVVIAAAAAILLLLLVCCITCCLRRSKKKRTQVATTKAMVVGGGDVEDPKDAAKTDQTKGLLAYAVAPDQSALESIEVKNLPSQQLYPDTSAAAATAQRPSPALVVFNTEGAGVTPPISRSGSGTQAGVFAGVAGENEVALRVVSPSTSGAGTPYGSRPASRRGSKLGPVPLLSATGSAVSSVAPALYITEDTSTPPEENLPSRFSSGGHLGVLNVAGRFHVASGLDEEEEEEEQVPVTGLRRLFGGGKKKGKKRETAGGGAEMRVPSQLHKGEDKKAPKGSLSVVINAGDVTLAQLQKLPRLTVVVVNAIDKMEEARGNSRLQYVFPGLHVGLKTVGVWFRGQEIARGQVTVLKDVMEEITLDVTIKPSILRVTTGDGKPYPDVMVYIFATHPTTFVKKRIADGRTDKDGDLCITLPEGLSPADYFFAEIRGPSGVLLGQHKDIRLQGSSFPTLLAA